MLLLSGKMTVLMSTIPKDDPDARLIDLLAPIEDMGVVAKTIRNNLIDCDELIIDQDTM